MARSGIDVIVNASSGAVERFEWQPERGEFALVSSERFRHTSGGWVPLEVTGQ